jgi:hypothetical protein
MPLYDDDTSSNMLYTREQSRNSFIYITLYWPKSCLLKILDEID